MPTTEHQLDAVPEVPVTVLPKIAPYWRYWNVGHYAYFRHLKEIGNARIEPYLIDEQQEEIEQLKTAFNSARAGRYVPTGKYVRLLKFQRNAYFDNEDATGPELLWQTVMSDTPDEMNDHVNPILKAHGRVLIHGLGLGCVLNCIRMKNNVTHIDVVEIDKDVIDLIAPFYAHDKKIEFHLGSCVDIKWPRGTRWDYAWHDIWTTISANNLTDDSEAEHGISYARLHRQFGSRVAEQDSWAFELARNMRRVYEIMETVARRWSYAWAIRSFDERLAMLIEATCPVGWPLGSWKNLMLNETMRSLSGSKEIYERYAERAMDSDMQWGEAYVILEDKARRYAMDKIGMNR